MVEVIAVLVILGILAAVAASRMGDDRGEVQAAAAKLKGHLRQAQLRALSADASWGIRSTGSLYWLFTEGDINNRGTLLDFSSQASSLGANAEIELPPGVTLSAFTLSFDQWGIPYDGADPLASDPLTAPMAITFSGGDFALTVTPNTGFIP